MSTNYISRKTIPYFLSIQSLLTMVPGVYLSKYIDEDNDQLRQEEDDQLHDTEQLPEDVQQFERKLQQEAQVRIVTHIQRVHNLDCTDLSTSSFSSSSDSNKTSPTTKKNGREIDSEIGRQQARRKQRKMRILSTITKQRRKQNSTTKCVTTMIKRSIMLHHQMLFRKRNN